MLCENIYQMFSMQILCREAQKEMYECTTAFKNSKRRLLPTVLVV